MNVLIARPEHARAREILFDHYTDQNVSDYTTIAFIYSEHRRRALWVVGQLVVLAAAGLALYNMIQGFRDSASFPLMGVSLALVLVSALVHRYNRNRTYNTPGDISATIRAAEHQNAPTAALRTELPHERGENQ